MQMQQPRAVVDDALRTVVATAANAQIHSTVTSAWNVARFLAAVQLYVSAEGMTAFEDSMEQASDFFRKFDAYCKQEAEKQATA